MNYQFLPVGNAPTSIERRESLCDRQYPDLRSSSAYSVLAADAFHITV